MVLSDCTSKRKIKEHCQRREVEIGWKEEAVVSYWTEATGEVRFAWLDEVARDGL